MEHHFNVNIARETGIIEAVLMNHLYFWIRKNVLNKKHYHDARYWTYNSQQAIVESFPYLSRYQIQRALSKLEEDGYILKGHYNTNPFDRTKWYAFSDKGINFLKTNGYDLYTDCAKSHNAKCKTTQSDCAKSHNDIDINNIIYKTDNNTDNIERDISNISSSKEESILSISPKKEDFSFDFSIVSNDLLPVVLEWLDYKKSRKELYKRQQDFKVMVNRLNKLSNGNSSLAKDIIEQSIANNYQGLFPLSEVQRHGSSAVQYHGYQEDRYDDTIAFLKKIQTR